MADRETDMNETTGMGHRGNLPYRIDRPDKVMWLPGKLKEISGIVYTGKNELACVQDEKGIVYIYNLSEEKVVSEIKFGPGGDYEGITVAGKDLFILRSDGVLFRIKDYKHKHHKVKKYKTGIPAANNEGLCYDPVNDQLLIACKSHYNGPGHKKYKGKQLIYSFNIKNKELSEYPAYILDVGRIHKFVKKAGIKTSGVKAFHPSEIAINPNDKNIYILSGSDSMLLIINPAGELLFAASLPKSLYPQAEGLAFTPDGTMYISNEGKNGKATILKFVRIRTN